MNFVIEVLGDSKSGNSWFVKVRELVKTGFGNMETEVGIGYITKPENAPALAKGDKVPHTGNVQFAPIVDQATGETTTVGGQYLHRVNLVSKDLPFVAPVQAKPTETPVSAPKVEAEVEVSADDEKPF